MDDEVAGKDATDAFFGLHRHEVLLTPRYARLQVGTIGGQEEQIPAPVAGAISKVPYAEPSWLAEGYHSAYYNHSHRKLQQWMRKHVEELLYVFRLRGWAIASLTVLRLSFEYRIPDAILREEDGKRPSIEVVQKSAYVIPRIGLGAQADMPNSRHRSEYNVHAMRLGPGKHLKGLTLAEGCVKPEEFDYFHELIIQQEFARVGQRGYGDGMQVGLELHMAPYVFAEKTTMRPAYSLEWSLVCHPYSTLDRTNSKLALCPISSLERNLFHWPSRRPSLDRTSSVFGMPKSNVNLLKARLSFSLTSTTATKSADGKNWTINGTKK